MRHIISTAAASRRLQKELALALANARREARHHSEPNPKPNTYGDSIMASLVPLHGASAEVESHAALIMANMMASLEGSGSVGD